MKSLLFCILLFSLSEVAVAQIKLREVGVSMSSKCFILNDKHTFRYYYSHCTGSEIGMGTYRITGNHIKFVFDSVSAPVITKSMNSDHLDSVKIMIREIGSNQPQWYTKIIYNDTAYEDEQTGSYTISYTGGEIGLGNFLDSVPSLFINPGQDSCNDYEIWWFDRTSTFVKSGKKVKMKRVYGKYRLRETVRGYTDKKGYYPMKRITYYR